MRFLFDHDVPDHLSFLLRALNHDVIFLRAVLPIATGDREVLRYALNQDLILLTCNRDDFLEAAKMLGHRGIIFVIRRNTRVAERSALLRLLERAGEEGIRDNINFA